jgi:hypothetical protein
MKTNFKWKDIKIPITECMVLTSIIGSIIFSFYIAYYCKSPYLYFFLVVWPPSLIGIIHYIKLRYTK